MENETMYKGFKIKVVQDSDPQSPREDCNVGTLVCWHSRYNLSDGGKNPFQTPQDALEYFKETNAIYLPVYMYDHSGLAFSTNGNQYPFNDRWDAGQVGFIYCELDNAKKEYGEGLTVEELTKKVKTYMEGEIETYNQYQSGDVWGYVIEDSKGEELNSCWGFYCSDEYCMQEAKNQADYYAEQAAKKKVKKTKAFIKNNVPLESRLEIV